LEILTFAASSRVNPRLAHMFMICSNIKLTGPAESIGIDALAIHERNQRDSTAVVQRRLEIPADANPAHGIPQKKALPFIVLSDHRPSLHLLDGARLAARFKPKAAQLGFGFNHSRHCERSEAIHRATKKEWIASLAKMGWTAPDGIDVPDW
jgi:hypothetical protein